MNDTEPDPLIGIRAVPPLRPLRWLALGWADLLRCPLPGLAHGLASALFGIVLLLVARDRFWFLAGALSGFLLVAPLVATGLYAVSRELALGGRPTLRTAWAAWRPHNRQLVHFGLLLALAGTGWVLTSAALITRFADAPVLGPADFLRVVVVNEQSLLFEAWLLLGSVLAAPMFVSSVVAIPLLLDREVSVREAVSTSVRTALASPPAMAFWATLLLAITLLSMATLMLGLVVAVPWLAHASWHAYVDIVEPGTAVVKRG